MGSGVERIDPLCFLARCRKRWLNQALSFSVGIDFLGVFCCLLGPLFVLMLVWFCICSVSWLLLVKLSVLAKWLARKTPLRKPLHSKEIISTKLRPKSAYDFWFIGLFCCFSVCLSFIPRRPFNIFHTSMAQYSLFVLKCRWTPMNQPANLACKHNIGICTTYIISCCMQMCVFICAFWFVCMSPFFYVSLSSWVISLTVFVASITNLNEPPRALAFSTITWVRS